MKHVDEQGGIDTPRAKWQRPGVADDGGHRHAFLAQLREHRSRQVDTDHAQPGCRQRRRHPSRADADLEHASPGPTASAIRAVTASATSGGIARVRS
jgi:hypothetical protein